MRRLLEQVLTPGLEQLTKTRLQPFTTPMLTHTRAPGRSGRPASAGRSLIKISTKALGDVLCLEPLVLLFPRGDARLLALLEVWPLPCVHGPEKMQRLILEMAGPEAKFCVCLEARQK